MLKHNPCLITYEKSLSFLRSHFGPDKIENIVHHWCFENIFQIPDTKDCQLIRDINSRKIIKNIRK